MPSVNFIDTIGDNRRDISLNELIDLQMLYGISVDAMIMKAKEDLQCHTNQLILEVSRLLDQNPDSIEDVIKQKISDYDAKKNNPICLYHLKDDNIKEQLEYYGFNVLNDFIIDETNQFEMSPNFFSVIFFVDPTKKPDPQKNTDFCMVVGERLEKGANYFYLGEGSFPTENCTCNFAQTPSTVYQNLLDLFRYIEFKKSVKNL